MFNLRIFTTPGNSLKKSEQGLTSSSVPAPLLYQHGKVMVYSLRKSARPSHMRPSVMPLPRTFEKRSVAKGCLPIFRDTSEFRAISPGSPLCRRCFAISGSALCCKSRGIFHPQKESSIFFQFFAIIFAAS